MEHKEDDDFKALPPFLRKKKLVQCKPEELHQQQKHNSGSFCPICQWSLGTLPESAKRSHLAACKGPLDQTKECPLGVKCQKPSSKHYREFSHQKLANKRSLSQEQFDLLMTVDSPLAKKQKTSKELKENGQLSMKLWMKSTDKRSSKGHAQCEQNFICESGKKNEVNVETATCVEEIQCQTYCPTDIATNTNNVKDVFVEQIKCEANSVADFVSQGKCIEETVVTSSEQAKRKAHNLIENEEEEEEEEESIFPTLEDLSEEEEEEAAAAAAAAAASCSDDHNCNSVASLSTESIKNIKNDQHTKESWKKIFHTKNCSTTDSPMSSVHAQSRLEQYPHNSKKQFKQCPFYKKIPDTTFVVDAFQYGIIPGVTHYFLSHFHSDHYGGLRKSFNRPIVCSRITATLVTKKLYVDRRYLQVVELMKPFIVNNVLITSLDANHCPGSLMFLFQLKSGLCYLHVGDFRATAEMKTYPAFANINVDVLFLDTTYCHPRHEFPKQEDVVSGAIKIALKYIREEPATLIVSGTYTIGKEKIFLGIANALNCKIWAPPGKRKVLTCLNCETITSRLVEYSLKAQVHVLPLTSVFHEDLEMHLKDNSKVFKRILAFSPTGWNFNKKYSMEEIPHVTKGRVTVISVPYSEHSSFSELRWFVKYLRPAKVIPTVQGRNISIASVAKLCSQWLSEDDSKEESPKQQQKLLTAFFSKKGV